MVLAVVAFVLFGLMALAGFVDINKLNREAKREEIARSCGIPVDWVSDEELDAQSTRMITNRGGCGGTTDGDPI